MGVNSSTGTEHAVTSIALVRLALTTVVQTFASLDTSIVKACVDLDQSKLVIVLITAAEAVYRRKLSIFFQKILPSSAPTEPILLKFWL